MEWVLRRDRRGQIDAFPFQDEERLRDASVERERAERAVVFVEPDGERWYGADAAGKILQLLPGWGWLGRVLLWPPVRPVARVVYRWVADHRPLVSRITGLGAGRS